MASAYGVRMWKVCMVMVVAAMLTREALCGGTRGSHFNWTFGNSAEKTYLLTNCYWWESLDHQLTTIVTLLSIAHNTSSIAVIPTMAAASVHGRSNRSILGDYFDLAKVQRVQRAITFKDFVESEDFKLMRRSPMGTVPLPKESQEEYELKLGLYGRLHTSTVQLQMPDEDPENTNQRCNRFAGTIHLSRDGRRRYVLLDRMHFLHFCTEKFMPWWYDVRQHVQPREDYMRAARAFVKGGGGAMMRRPVAVVHVNDVMEAQKRRDDEQIERYARDIVDALRVQQALGGSLYVMYRRSGHNVGRVVHLLRQEFERVYDSSHLPDKSLSHDKEDNPQNSRNSSEHAAETTEWALAVTADAFVGNIHSPLSRNIALHRKTHGNMYVAIRGFAELRKVWSWNL